MPADPGELTYGLERLAMYLQGRDSIFDITWVDGITYGDVYHQNEVEQSRYNFELANTEMLFEHFRQYESEAQRLMSVQCALPAYEMVFKCSHTFNLLDARGRNLGDGAGRLHRPRAQPRPRHRQVLLRVARAAGLSADEATGSDAQASTDMKKRRPATATSAPATLLVEVRTEELPPKALQRLSQAFAEALAADLRQDDVFLTDSSEVRTYATPRRLAVQITHILPRAPDKAVEISGPSVKIGLDGKANRLPH
jgi:hypothetical protein